MAEARFALQPNSAPMRAESCMHHIDGRSCSRTPPLSDTSKQRADDVLPRCAIEPEPELSM